MRILLAGTNRCGSTWVTNVLARASGVAAVFEPDAPESDILGAVSASRIGKYPSLAPDERSGWYSMVWDLAFRGGWPWARMPSARSAGRGLARAPRWGRDYAVAALARTVAVARPRPEHVVVKSVNSALTLEWIARRYRPRIVILRRNPMSVVSSWFVLNLNGDPTLASRAAVHDRWLQPLGVPLLPSSSSPIAAIAWQVGALMSALRATAARHPEWTVVSYDDLSEAPVPQFRSLFERLGLPWTGGAEAYLQAADDPAFMVRGAAAAGRHPNERTGTNGAQSRRLEQRSAVTRRLSAAQIAEARAVLADMPLHDWALAEVR